MPSVFFSTFYIPTSVLNSPWQDSYRRSLHSGFKCNSLHEVFLLRRRTSTSEVEELRSWRPSLSGKSGRPSSAREGVLAPSPCPWWLVLGSWFGFWVQNLPTSRAKIREVEMTVNVNLKRIYFLIWKLFQPCSSITGGAKQSRSMASFGNYLVPPRTVPLRQEWS